MDEKTQQEIKAMVDSFFSEKEEAEVRRKTEEALQRSAETISELTTALEGKNSESEEVATQVEELNTKIAELTSELEAAQDEKASADEKLTEAENTIEEMKKDKAAEARMAELEEAGVASGKEAQTARVREMADEEFVAYKEERIELRSAVIAELESSEGSEEEGAEEGSEEEGAEEGSEEEGAEEGSEEGSEEEEVDTPPAEIDPGQAVSAALNFETVPSSDVMSKYAEMGKAMADIMTGKKDK